MKNRIYIFAPLTTMLVIILVNLVTFYYSQCNSDSFSSTDYRGNSQTVAKDSFKQYKTILNSLPDDNEEAIEAVTKTIYGKLGFEAESQKAYSEYLYTIVYEKNQDIEDYNHVKGLLENNQYTENMRKNISINAQAITTSHIFDENENGQNIAATARDFYEISTMSFPLELDNGVNIWVNYRITDYLMVILACTLAVFISVYNRARLEKNIQKKQAVIVPGAAILAGGIALMYVINAMLVYRFIDKYNLNSYLQSYYSFRYCPMLMRLWLFMLITILMKVVIGLLIYGLLVAIMHCSEKKRPILIGITALFILAETVFAFGDKIMLFMAKEPVGVAGAGSFMMSFGNRANAGWILLREINIFSMFTFERFFITYENLLMFENVVARLPIFVIFSVLIAGGVFITCRYSVAGYSTKMHEQLQYRYYEEINQKYTETRQLWHDFHNHLLAIQELMRRGEIDAANNYMKELEDDIDNAHILTKSGSEALDVLIYQKSELARRANVKLEVHINTKVNSEEFQDTAICCVVGNLLDNCIEAVSKLAHQDNSAAGNRVSDNSVADNSVVDDSATDNSVTDNRYAILEISKKGDMLFVSTENCFDGKVEKDAKGYKTTKEDKASHGIGLSGVKRICEKYNGSMQISVEDNVFRVKALLMARKH